MKFDASEAESSYASMQSGVTTFTMNALASYKDLTDELRQQLKLITDKYNQIKKELEELRKKHGESEPHPLTDK